jgi:peptide/nickel transport system substrate-binding protein
VSTEDVRFTWEDILNNTDITPNFPQYLRDGNSPDGAPGKLEILDDSTFRLSFENAYGGIPMQLAICTWKGYSELINPAHYLKQWHAEYTPLADLESQIKDAGLG